MLLGTGADSVDLVLVLQERMQQLIVLPAKPCYLLLQILEHCLNDLKIAL